MSVKLAYRWTHLPTGKTDVYVGEFINERQAWHLLAMWCNDAWEYRPEWVPDGKRLPYGTHVSRHLGDNYAHMARWSDAEISDDPATAAPQRAAITPGNRQVLWQRLWRRLWH